MPELSGEDCYQSILTTLLLFFGNNMIATYKAVVENVHFVFKIKPIREFTSFFFDKKKQFCRCRI